MANQVLAPEQLLRKASDMVPVLKDRAAETEVLRRITMNLFKTCWRLGCIRSGFPAVRRSQR